MNIIKCNYVLEIETGEGRVFIGSDIGPIKLGKCETLSDGVSRSSTFYIVEQNGCRYLVELFTRSHSGRTVDNTYDIYKLDE